MNLKPMYDTGTITFMDSPKNVTLQKIDASFAKDPEGIIPNGIYKVFKSEKKKQLFLLSFNFAIIALCIIVLALFTSKFKNEIHWFWYVPTMIALGLSITKLIFVLLDRNHLNSSIKLYRESLSAGSKLTPPFISNMYMKLYKKQVTQNWLVIFFLFYGTIITLLFWWLKDADWWVFHFKEWIHNLTKNPELVGAIMVSILVVVLLLHVYYTVYRKKRIIDIQSFFGNEVISQVEINAIVDEKNKFFKKIFFLSILIVLVLPFIIRVIYKKAKKS